MRKLQDAPEYGPIITHTEGVITIEKIWKDAWEIAAREEQNSIRNEQPSGDESV